MGDVQSSQAQILAATSASVDIQSSQALLLAAGIYPAESVETSQLQLMAAVDSSIDLEVSQVSLLVVGAGRVSDPRLCAWTFTLDGHDYYVLRLGTTTTLVYDTHSEQWYTWGSGSSYLWRAFTGTNWLGGLSAGSAWSNVVVGDDGNGALYFLGPNSITDDHSLTGEADPQPFVREVTGQVVLRGYGRTPCFGVELLASIGDQVDASFTSVNLLVSDDRGHGYVDCGSRSVIADTYDTRLDWRSLGSMSYPGRLFRIRDEGALKRLDGLEMTEQR